jgi:hypothetical protein
VGAAFRYKLSPGTITAIITQNPFIGTITDFTTAPWADCILAVSPTSWMGALGTWVEKDTVPVAIDGNAVASTAATNGRRRRP